MSENLVIVESPAKAKTIEKFLGKNFTVKSSFGHIRDLSKKNYGVDIKNGFKPKYEIDPEKKKIVSELKKEVKKAQTIWLASDEDREGEAIAWHLAEVLKLPADKTKRIVFHEITKQAIEKAIKNPRAIDENLVNSQQARRILDRLVGFELSEVLWKKVKSNLSAGRVQSVAVRLIVEREREILNFKTESSYKITAVFNVTDHNSKKTLLKAELPKRFENLEKAKKFIEDCVDATFTITEIEKKPAKKSPAPPFTTSTLQQEAARKLGFSVTKTMRLAQNLYEAGQITYMRTDSVNLSEEAIKLAKNYITNEYGSKYSKARKYKTKTKGAQEAHEAIRPTHLTKNAGSTADEQRLYELIFKRFIASQMADAKIERTNVTIDISTRPEKLSATGEVLLFDGFIKVYTESDDNEDDSNPKTMLPPLKNGQILELKELTATEKFSHHPPRYTEASLVKKLEELGIGRPSTYAPIISTIQKRGYVVKEDRPGKKRQYNVILLKNKKITQNKKTENTGAEKNKLFPTDIAMVVNDFLLENFEKVMDYNFTATVEKDFDKIAEGKLVWNKMIEKFYKTFHKTIEQVIKNSDRTQGERQLGTDPETGKPIIVRIGRFGPIVQLGDSEDPEKKYASLKKGQLIENITLEEALELLENDNNGRLLGTDPETGKNVYARIGRFGPMVQLGETGKKEKPKYAPLLKGMNVETITFDQALALLRMPRELGKYEDKKVSVAIGRFGPYVSHAGKFISLKKNDNPLTISLERAIELIEEKRKTEKDRLIKEFDQDKDLKIIKDRWGRPTIYYKKKYFKIPKDKEANKLTLEECMKIIENETDTTKKKK